MIAGMIDELEAMDQLPATFQQTFIGGVLNECVLEGIRSVRRTSATEDQFGLSEPTQG